MKNRLTLDNDWKADFLINDCGIDENVVISFLENKLWSDSLTFMQNANRCREHGESFK